MPAVLLVVNKYSCSFYEQCSYTESSSYADTYYCHCENDNAFVGGMSFLLVFIVFLIVIALFCSYRSRRNYYRAAGRFPPGCHCFDSYIVRNIQPAINHSSTGQLTRIIAHTNNRLHKSSYTNRLMEQKLEEKQEQVQVLQTQIKVASKLAEKDAEIALLKKQLDALSYLPIPSIQTNSSFANHGQDIARIPISPAFSPEYISSQNEINNNDVPPPYQPNEN